MIRSFLEDLVLPVYFGTNPPAYLRWQANNYETPSLRGKKGLLNKLVNVQAIDEKLKDKVSDLYGSLNSFIHGSERRLVNKGHYTRSWVGRRFNMDDYEEWCNHVTEAVTIALKLLKINLAQWGAFRAAQTIVCPICHNNQDFKSTDFVFGGEQFTQYHCQVCGDEMTHSFDGRQAYGQSFGDKLVSYQQGRTRASEKPLLTY